MKSGHTLTALAASVIAALCLSACPLGPESLPPSGLVQLGTHSYKLWLPPDFATNLLARYPLVISLHGGTSSTDYYFAPCIVDDEQEYRRYPCVFFAPNSPAGYGTDQAWLRETIDAIIKNPAYRVDANRIYIIGFSMGGFGCTNLTRDLFNDYGYFVAGIVPSGGGDYPTIPAPDCRARTAMWTHYGLDGDFPQETDYEAAKAYLEGATEMVLNDNATYTRGDGSTQDFPRQTRSLYLRGHDLFKISTYAGMGHTSAPVYQDYRVLDWLFAQNIVWR